jgi:predicted  nucleic acid-binding Zn-ribbon protein
MRLFALAVLVLALSSVHAQDKKAQEAMRRLHAANQKLASEKAQLERERAKLAQEREGLAGELKQSRGKAARAERALRKAEADREALERRLGEAEAREAALKAGLAQTEKALAEARRNGEQLGRRLANQTETIGFWQKETGACRERNGELVKLGRELAERYRNKTCADIAVENEPFTGIGRARMENLLEDYEDKLRAQRYEVTR